MALTSKELKEARRAGFKRKAPKKPKRSAKLATLEAYAARLKDYEKDVKSAASEHRKAEAIKKRIFK